MKYICWFRNTLHLSLFQRYVYCKSETVHNDPTYLAISETTDTSRKKLYLHPSRHIKQTRANKNIYIYVCNLINLENKCNKFKNTFVGQKELRELQYGMVTKVR
jgi:hypothetical protein